MQGQRRQTRARRQGHRRARQLHAGQIGHDRAEFTSGPGRHRGVHPFAEFVEREHALAHRTLQESGNVFAIGIPYA
ncbi:hypothetical protein MCHIJ_38510 [Mycolicibacterium chitae]|nr:hypothetical protein MCHIJ_38510 [Mycolicibacterium chitae]